MAPAQVTIFDGSSSATFTVTAADDFVADGAQTVTITATAFGFTNGVDTLQVLDNDGGTGGDDHGNNASTATTVGVGSMTSGSIEVGTDTDWFRVATTAGTQYTFRTILGTLLDSRLTLYNTDGVSVLIEDDDSGGGRASQIQWTVAGQRDVLSEGQSV